MAAVLGSCLHPRRPVLHSFAVLVCVCCVLSCRQVYAIPSSNMLQVPYHAQEGDIWCAPAAIQMAIEYISGEKVPQAVLAKEMDTGPACGGTCLDNMSLPFLNRDYVQVSDLQGGFHTTLDELKELNSQGYVSIINIHFDTDHKSGHNVVVIGYNTAGIIVHDPVPTSWGQPDSRKTGPNAFISNDLLSDLWSRHDQWALKIRYTYRSIPEFSSTALVFLATFAVATVLLTRRRTPN